MKDTNIKCPRCKGCAVLDTPWDFYKVRKVASPSDIESDYASKGYTFIERGTKNGRWVLLGDDTPDLSGRSYYLSNDYLVIEKYPYLMHREQFRSDRRWERQPYILKCTECHLVDAYTLNWPQDAYFQWDIRGHTLWAFSREHAHAILEFIKSAERDETQFGGYSSYLRKMPSHFISAKMRDLIVKEISTTLKLHATV